MTHLLLIGCGNMGRALLSGMQRAGVRASVVEPTGKPVGGVAWFPQLADVPASDTFTTVLLAVKPQHMHAVLPEVAARCGTAPLYVSIAAGISTHALSGMAGEGARIIRAMPNTPALVGQGMTALYASHNVNAAERTAAESLFAALGRVEWLADEDEMHAVTALSGSGPAYLFLFLEALAEAAVELGLPPELARTLAVQTMVGSAALATQEAEIPLEHLRKNVTSPGGTTDAGLRPLMQHDVLKRLVENALLAAAERSRELAG